MNVLVVAAHPDDEVLGCGGTMAKLASEGHAVSIAILGEGLTSRLDDPTKVDEEQLAELHRASQRVADFLGAKQLHTFNLPDNRFDSVPLLDVIKPIEKLISEIKPEVVYTQHGGDLNIDHSVTYRAVMTAVRPMIHCPVRALYSYEVNSSSEWSFQKFSPVFRGQIFHDISDYLDKKVDAMMLYESEAQSFPYPRSAEALRAQAQRWGSVCGMNAAEAFEVVWEKR